MVKLIFFLVIPNTTKNKGMLPEVVQIHRSMSKIIMIGPLDSDAAEIINKHHLADASIMITQLILFNTWNPVNTLSNKF